MVSGKQCVHRNKKKRNSKDVESENKTKVFVTLRSRLEQKVVEVKRKVRKLKEVELKTKRAFSPKIRI